ncbi:ribonuclease HI [SAR86 cluster bacterium]|nr:ribonuclease HI [SAR86 cluster bacterium]
MKIIRIYTDGACRGNPGPGGWGALILKDNEEIKLNGGQNVTTNNQMELTAVIKALDFFSESTEIEIFTDSKYVMDGITEYIKKWKVNGWKTASKKPVKNSDLWKQLDVLNAQHSIRWNWVKGHSGLRENDIADELANLGIDNL